MSEIERLLNSRDASDHFTLRKKESEGGCGVIGIASQKKIRGKHLIPPLLQMKNRGNGKGGGIVAAGFLPKTFGVTQAILDRDYMIAIAFLEPTVQKSLYQEFIEPLFEVDHICPLAFQPNFAQTVIYFVRVKKEKIEAFRQKNLLSLPDEMIEDELVYQNSYRLNQKFYISTGEKRAFVLSHGKNLLVLKCVGYGDDVVRGYHMEEVEAHLWVGHHRYPTKGRVWHPGGAHPFVGLHEALVHNGDFANYSSICEYLAQRNIHPLFLTDTEVSALLFDLLSRTYNYPLEYVLEALAPTTERDFFHLPQEKQRLYELIQKTHLQSSPDGPWFFIIAQSRHGAFKLIGITDTSMLRPQVFAWQKGEHSIGAIASEKQAIDAFLASLAEEESTFWPRADYYWSGRGGSYTDGGAFVFTVQPDSENKVLFSCANKFGRPFAHPPLNSPAVWGKIAPQTTPKHFPDYPAAELFSWAKNQLHGWSYEEAADFLTAVQQSAQGEKSEERALDVLTKLIDHVYPLEKMRRSFFLALVDKSIAELIHAADKKLDRKKIIIDASTLSSEGENSLARELIKKYEEGFKKFVVGNCKGQRFIGNGFGPSSYEVEIDVYGASGDYLASGIDGAHIRVHGNGQDQLGQIMKEGRLIIFGDAGQTLMYGAKGGCTFVRGSTAGRPLINAVGTAKLVINGTSLDYFAESYMAGDPLKGGGFAIINSICFNQEGEIDELDPPYSGCNLFSLASGGALYVRDPDRKLGTDQLNGGEFTELTLLDQNLIAPYLEENARLFEIPLSRLLQKNKRKLTFQEAYRKIIPAPTHFIDPEKAWVTQRK